MATKYLAKTYKYGALVQTNWATPNTREANFKTIPYNAGVTVFEPDVKVESYNTTGQNGIHKEFERVKVDARSGLPKVNFSMPADVETLAPHLGQALLAVTQGAATTFVKTITCAGLTGTVDFNGDDVSLFTICCDDQASVDDGIILENAIIDSLNLSIDFNAEGLGRLLNINGVWVGNEMNFEQTIETGTWVDTTLVPMGDTDLFSFSTFTVDGANWAAQNIRRFTFNVANNVRSDSATTAGKANNYDITPVYTSTIILDYNATTETALKDFQDGKTIVATLDSSIGAATKGNLTITCTGGILQKQPFIYNGDFAGIELDVLWHSTAAATPVSISFTDDEDWGY